MPAAAVVLGEWVETPAPAVWLNWNQAATTTPLSLSTASTTTNTVVWEAWNQATTGTGYTATQMPVPAGGWYQIVWSTWNATAGETAGQRRDREAAQRRQDEETRRRRDEAAAEWEAAKQRALELLSLCLTPEQMDSYTGNGWFEVTGSRGRRWRIRARGQAGNVDLMPEIGEQREATFCAHPPGGLPDPDAHLAQMLALITDEEEFVRTANCHYRRAA